MNKDGIKEYAGIGAFVLLAIVAGGGLEGKPPEDLQHIEVIDEVPAPASSPAAKTEDGHIKEATGDGHAAKAPAKTEDALAKTEDAPAKTEDAPAVETVKLDLDDLNSAIDATGYSKWGEQTVIFNPAAGSFSFPEGHYEQGKIEGTIDMDLMIHDKQLLIDHIQEPKFFNSAEYPESTFESLGIEKVDDGYKITGKLTIKGNTKTIAFIAQISEDDESVTIESRNIGLKTTYWDLKYPNVKEDIKLDIELVFKKG